MPNLGLGLDIGSIHRLSSVNQKVQHSWVAETLARTSNRTISFTGTVYYVNSAASDDTGNGLTEGTAKKTIMAAYGIAASGSIIQLMDGTHTTQSNTGGYMLINTSAKRILIRGNAADRTAVTLTQSAAGSYAIRLRDCGETVFQNMILSSDQNSTIFSCDDNQNTTVVCDNCILTTANAGTSSFIMSAPGNASFTKYIEFKNCTFNKALGATKMFGFENLKATGQLLFTNCTFNHTNCSVFLTSKYYCPFSVYDSTFNQVGTEMPVRFGEDVTTPTVTCGLADFRSNTLNVTGATHSVLFGRGVKFAYAVNNKLYTSSANNALAIALVIKSTPDNVGDCIYEGNYCEGSRPILIKGGSKNQIKYNSFVAKNADWETIGFQNYKLASDEVLSQANVISNNNVVTLLYGIKTYASTGESEAVMVAIATCTMDNNKYYLPENKYAYNTQEYLWADKATFWGDSVHDANSTLIPANQLPIELPV